VESRYLKPIDIERSDKDRIVRLAWPLESASTSPVTPKEKWLLRELSRCEFKAGSADKQFCHGMWVAANATDNFSMTAGQQAYLWRLGYSYRGQLSPDVNTMVEMRLVQLMRGRSTL
jgi:hypothetical protein